METIPGLPYQRYFFQRYFFQNYITKIYIIFLYFFSLLALLIHKTANLVQSDKKKSFIEKIKLCFIEIKDHNKNHINFDI